MFLLHFLNFVSISFSDVGWPPCFKILLLEVVGLFDFPVSHHEWMADELNSGVLGCVCVCVCVYFLYKSLQQVCKVKHCNSSSVILNSEGPFSPFFSWGFDSWLYINVSDAFWIIQWHHWCFVVYSWNRSTVRIFGEKFALCVNI